MTSATLTSKGRATRDRIVAGAAEVIRELGIDTTLDDIRARTSTSKSQLFHYFPDGKDQLLLAVAHLEADRVLADQQPHLSALTSWPAWDAWRNAVVERYRRQGQMCPLNGLINQLGRATPGAQAVSATLLENWQREIRSGIQDMQRIGQIRAGIDAESASAALLAGIQGGVTIMLSTGSLRHLEAAMDQSIAFLRT